MYKTRQDVFNKVWDHFVVKKNPKSISSKRNTKNRPICIYGSTGCAIGCLIEDKKLCEEMDKQLIHGKDTGITNLLVLNWKIADALKTILDIDNTSRRKEERIDSNYLQDIQSVHDYCYGEDFTSEIKTKLIEHAARFNLKVPKDENVQHEAGGV